jgi:hypothetical protein
MAESFPLRHSWASSALQYVRKVAICCTHAILSGHPHPYLLASVPALPQSRDDYSLILLVADMKEQQHNQRRNNSKIQNRQSQM